VRIRWFYTAGFVIAILVAFVILLNPDAAAQREVAQARALAQPGVSPQSLKALFLRRGYQCADRSGDVVFVCDKRVTDWHFFCNEMVMTALQTQGTSTELQVHSQEFCL
jgi:hypothetical protein